MNDYQKTVTLAIPIHQVYTALTEQIADWWSNDLHGAARITGDVYDIAFNNTKKTFKIVEAIQDRSVTWECTKAHIDMASLENKSEWLGTRIHWNLSTDDAGHTVLHFKHEGLNPAVECYTVCESGWNHYLKSLETFLVTGTGMPHVKKDAILAPTLSL